MHVQTVIVSMDDFEQINEVFQHTFSIIAHCEPDGAYKLVYEGMLYYADYLSGRLSIEDICDTLFDKFDYDTRQYVSRVRAFEIETSLTNQIWSGEFSQFILNALENIYCILKQKRVPALAVKPNTLRHTQSNSYNQMVFHGIRPSY
jgi:hypothetical protein